MHKYAVPLVMIVMLCCAPPVHSATSELLDWGQWKDLPTQEGGRQKPLDTLAWETFRTLSNRTSLTDPQTGDRLDANRLYMTLLFEWKGWDQERRTSDDPGMHHGGNYFGLHKPDKWDEKPLLRVDYLELRAALGMKKDEKYISPSDVSRAKIEVPLTHEQRPFLLWAESLLRKKQHELSIYEKKALELADRFWSYQDHRMGNRLHVLPIKESQDQQWLSISDLLGTRFTDEVDPTGKMREAQQLFREARTAYLSGSAREFNAATTGFLATMRELGPQLGAYPAAATIDLEVLYNHWAPFRFAWVFMMLAFVSLLLGMGSGWKPFLTVGWITFVLGLCAVAAGFVMRVSISGRAPVTNMYESVIYVGLGVAMFGAAFELIYRRRYILTAAAAVATVALVLADNCPAALDPSLQPLQPVLRSNFWLVIHVMTITLSYAAFALALGIGNITLGYFLAGSSDAKAIGSLTTFTYRAMQIGVLLLAAGTILGGVWADYSWGRFWGWDPKEVWALIALLGYLAVLHARYAGWVRQFGLAALSVICFSLVVMAWYGVNFVLGAGLHSYGFGGGGAPTCSPPSACKACTYLRRRFGTSCE